MEDIKNASIAKKTKNEKMQKKKYNSKSAEKFRICKE